MSADLTEVQNRFISMLPELQSRAKFAFRRLGPEAREDAVAETVAACWQNHVHCVLEGKKIGAASLAHYALLNVKNGRSMAGGSKTDVLSPVAGMAGRAAVESLEAVPSQHADTGWWERSEAFEDRRVCDRPFHRVRIRHDYGHFLAAPEVSDRERDMFQLLADGYRTSEIARRLGVSAPCISQLKWGLRRKLRQFFGADVDPTFRPGSCSGRRRRTPAREGQGGFLEERRTMSPEQSGGGTTEPPGSF